MSKEQASKKIESIPDEKEQKLDSKTTALREAVLRELESSQVDTPVTESDGTKTYKKTPSIKKHSDHFFSQVMNGLKMFSQNHKNKQPEHFLPVHKSQKHTEEKQPTDTATKRLPSEQPTEPVKKPAKNDSDDKTPPQKIPLRTSLLFFVLNLSLTLVLLSGLVVVIVGVGIYNNAIFSEDTKLEIATLIPYPAGIVNSEVLTIADFRTEVAALNKFYAVQADSGLFTTYPTTGGVQDIVWERFIQNVITQEIATTYNIFISESEIKQELGVIISDAEGEENLTKQLAFLYGWNIETFVTKVLQPFLLREKLASELFTNQDLREIKRSTAEAIYNQVSTDSDNFARYAEEYSEDKTTSGSGGDLGFFQQQSVSDQLEQVLLDLQPGQVSQIIETQEGFEIIKLEQKVLGTDGQYRFNARRILVRYPTFEELFEQQRNQATIYRFVR